jgi:hypothetical protein
MASTSSAAFESAASRGLFTCLRRDPETQAYAARRTAEGKSAREIKRCLKRHLARHRFKLLERAADTGRLSMPRAA